MHECATIGGTVDPGIPSEATPREHSVLRPAHAPVQLFLVIRIIIIIIITIIIIIIITIAVSVADTTAYTTA
jgi:hypothetical protein